MLGLGLPLLLFFLLGTAGAESSFHLPAPQNVTIVSYNFQNTLKWSPVMGINNAAVSYSVECCRLSGNWTAPQNSRNITKPEYYFTNESCENMRKFRDYVKVIFRVRAEQGELKSDWVETSPFRARDKTVLGPPREINATVKANSIVVSYKAPFDSNTRYFPFQYLISYWEKLADKELPSFDKAVVVSTSNTKYKLANLAESTEYCFRVQATLPEKGLRGHLSDIHCKKTYVTETNILSITLTSVAAVAVLIIIFFLLRCIQKHQNVIKSLWRPPLTIPLHYKEDLQNHQMSMFEQFKNCAGEDHSVSVITSVEQNPTGTNPAGTNSTDCSHQEVHLPEDHRLI